MKIRMTRTARSPRRALVAIACGCWLTAMDVTRSDEASATDVPKSAFEPGDIAIGEPIPLQFAAPRSEVVPPAGGPPLESSEPRSLLADPKAAATVPSSQPRGTGWIGLQVAESTEPGRWAISEVATGGPAATGGIAVGDEVRAINGVLLRSAEDVAEALTALAPGQRVSLAMARHDQPLEISLVAVERPVTLSSRTWQSSPEPNSQPQPPAAEPPFAAAPPFATGPRFAESANGSVFQPESPSDAVPAAAPVSPAAPPQRSPSPQGAASLPPPASGSAPAVSGSPTGRTALGVRTLPIDPAMQARFHLQEAAGAYVIGVVQDLPASKAGVPPGSVIVALDDRPVRSPDELTRLVTTGPVGRPVTLQYVLPGGASHRADVVLQALERPLEAALVGPEPMTSTSAPRLEPSPPPTTLRRPESPSPVASARSQEAQVIEREVKTLRAKLDLLEQRLEAIAR